MSSTLDEFLQAASAGHPALRPAATTISHLAEAAIALQSAIASGRVPQAPALVEDHTNASGETQKSLDLYADQLFHDAALKAPVAWYGSEEQDQPVPVGEGELALAIDPLDGSSNIETNIAVGTIFSLLPLPAEHQNNPAGIYAQPGTAQRAAGFFMYGAQLLLIVTLGQGTQVFLFVPDEGRFLAMGAPAAIPAQAAEFSTNTSNRRHWHAGMRAYVEDLEAGKDGPRGRNFGMRYVGSLVAEAYRILQRGGVFLYPSDRRSGYESGRLRQLYETNPISFCIEQAGGAATDGTARMLETAPRALHAKTPFVFGSRHEVETIASYFGDAAAG